MNNFFTGKSILVTGAGGYLAGNLITALEASNARIKCLSRKEPPGASHAEWIQADITVPEIWRTALPGVEIVFHLAAQTSARIADENPEEDYRINVVPVLNLIKAAANRPGLAILFAGTATQCGIPKTLPVNESHPDHPVTAYDRHKLAAERALLEATRIYNIKAASLRLANIYGPGGVSGATDRGIINQMAARALRGEELTLLEAARDLIRDYLFVEDAVEAFLAAAPCIDAVSGGYYVVGSDTRHTIGEAFEKIASIAGEKSTRKISVRQVPGLLSGIDRRNFTADSSLFRTKTGWFPRYSLDRGIRIMIEELSCVS